MRTSDCFEKRLLRKTKPDKLKMKKALEMAELKRERAGNLFNNEFYEESIVSSYTCMFQAARALLFLDGIIEKSHACVVLYLRENYATTLGHDRISWLDTYRLERHESFKEKFSGASTKVVADRSFYVQAVMAKINFILKTLIDI